MSRRDSRGRARGFTLIEVVVAFVLLTLVLATGFEIFSAGLRRAGELEDYSRALVIAQSHLARAGTEEAFKEGEQRGESEDRRFRWAVGVARTEEGLPQQPGQLTNNPFILYRIDVRVQWNAGDGRERNLALATLALGQKPQ